MDRWNVGILIFPQVEVLDFAGPFEVFSRTRLVPGADSRRSEESAPFVVFTVARSRELITATGGLHDEETLDWIRRVARDARQVTSVCTGSLLLARAGLLKGRRATTHFLALDLLQEVDPSIRVMRDQRVVDDGIITSAGVAAGLDMAFLVVERLCGWEVAEETSRYVEYRWPAVGPG